MRNLLIITILSIVFFSCENQEACTKIDDQIIVDLEIDRAEQRLFAAQNWQDAFDFVQAEPQISKVFFQGEQYPSDTLLADEVLRLISNPELKKLYLESDGIFGNLADLETQLEIAFANIKHYYPDFTPPKIKTIVTGLQHDLYVSEEMIIIGLDYYNGPDAIYRPIGLTDYILARYQKEYIVPSILLLISQAFNAQDPQDQTLLTDMTFYGKAFSFVKTVLPCLPDSTIIGYTPQELDESEENAGTIWGYFIDNQLLYEKNYFIKEKYVGERPKTFEIGNACPGRIGQWLGWQITKQYVEETNAGLVELMKQTNGEAILRQSKYKPDRR